MSIRERIMVTGAPDSIYLTYGDLEKDCSHDEVYALGEVLWCQDMIEESDVRYVRADLAEARERELLAQRDELLAAGQRVTRAFKALGVSRRFSDELEARAECERAMVALDAAIAKAEGGGA